MNRDGALRDLLRVHWLAELGHAAAVGLVMWPAVPHVPTSYLIVWAAVVMTIQVGRLILRRVLPRWGIAETQSLRLLRASVLLLGLSWGAAVLPLWAQLPFDHFVLCVLTYCMIAGAGVLVFGVDAASVYLFFIAVLAPVLPGIMAHGFDDLHVAMVGMVVLYAVATLSFYRRVELVERERREAETALRESEEWFRFSFEDSPVGKSITAPDGRLLRVNPAFCAILGYSVAELLRVSWMDITHPDDVAQSQECLRALLAGEADSWAMEKRYRARDGRWVWTHVSIGVHRGPSGEPRYFFSHVQNISDQKRAAERLRDSERRLAAAQAIAHVGSWEWHISTNRVMWSDELYRMYGVPAGTTASYDAFQERVHPDDRDRVARIIARGLADCVTVDYEWRLVRPDGEVRHMLGRNVTLVDENGVATGLAGTTLDVTERKRAEAALAKSEAYHRRLIEQALDIITIIDADAVMRYLSPSVERILGYSRSELVGQRAFDFIHPDDLEATLRTFTEGIETPGTVRRLEYRFRHKDGSWRYLEGVGRNLLDDPLINAVVVNARDVTERKVTEENQRTLLRELQSALAEVRTLRGLIRICSHCKRVLTDDGAWQQFESYVRGHSHVEFSHGICPDCARQWSNVDLK
jgi:PAS domain S-box-containing protein